MKLTQLILEKDLKIKKLIEFPEFRQAFVYDCGASAFQCILAFFGIDEREEVLLDTLESSEDEGTGIENIKKVAKDEYDIETKELNNLTIDSLKEFLDKDVPVLMLIQAWPDEEKDSIDEWENEWEEGHYVVAVGYTDKEIIFEDPSMVVRTYIPFNELDKRWHDVDYAPSGKKKILDHWGMIFSKNTDYEYDPMNAVKMEHKINEELNFEPKSGSGFIDPQGNFHTVRKYEHSEFARKKIKELNIHRSKAQNIEFFKNQNVNFIHSEIYELLKIGWIRVTENCFEVYKRPTNKQKDFIFIFAKNNGYENIYVDSQFEDESSKTFISGKPEELYEQRRLFETKDEQKVYEVYEIKKNMEILIAKIKAFDPYEAIAHCVSDNIKILAINRMGNSVITKFEEPFGNKRIFMTRVKERKVEKNDKNI